MIRVEKWKHVLASGVGCKDLCHNFAHVDMVKQLPVIPLKRCCFQSSFLYYPGTCHLWQQCSVNIFDYLEWKTDILIWFLCCKGYMQSYLKDTVFSTTTLCNNFFFFFLILKGWISYLLQIKDCPIALDLGCWNLPFKYSTTDHFPNAFLCFLFESSSIISIIGIPSMLL